MEIRNLPSPGISFVGRSDLVRDLSRGIRAYSFITLTGVGGAGKSRLALAVAEKVQGRFTDGCFYLNFSQLPSQASVQEAVLAAVADNDHSREQPGKKLMDYIGDGSPIHVFSRATTREVDLGEGAIIPRDPHVIHSYAAAKRDERRYDDPERFDILRNPRDHLAFDFGTHACPGRRLATLEAHALLALRNFWCRSVF